MGEDTCMMIESLNINLGNMYDPWLPADFDPIAMGVEDPPEAQEDSWDLDDDSDIFDFEGLDDFHDPDNSDTTF